MNKKYILTNETETVRGKILHRIKAVRDIENPNGIIKKGSLGGFIETEENLSHDLLCWVYDDACVFDDARVYGNAVISKNARIYDRARIFNNAIVTDESYVYNNACINGWAKICGASNICNYVCVHGHAYVEDADVCKNANICGHTYVRNNYDYFVIDNIKVDSKSMTFSKDEYGKIYVNNKPIDDFKIMIKAEYKGKNKKILKKIIKLAKLRLSND